MTGEDHLLIFLRHEGEEGQSWLAKVDDLTDPAHAEHRGFCEFMDQLGLLPRAALYMMLRAATRESAP